MLVAAVVGFGGRPLRPASGLGFVAGALAGAALALLFATLDARAADQPVRNRSGAGAVRRRAVGLPRPAAAGREPAGARADGIPRLRDIPVVGPALVRAALARLRSRCRWPALSRGSCSERAAASCCARSASRPNRPTRSATRCAASASPRWPSAARAPDSRAPICRSVYTPLWSEGMVAGRGWIALALVTFATWRPGRVLLGAYLFGGVTMLQFHLQGTGVEVPSQLLAMTPLSRHDRRAGADLAQSALDPPEHAGLARQAVQPERLAPVQGSRRCGCTLHRYAAVSERGQVRLLAGTEADLRDVMPIALPRECLAIRLCATCNAVSRSGADRRIEDARPRPRRCHSGRSAYLRGPVSASCSRSKAVTKSMNRRTRGVRRWFGRYSRFTGGPPLTSQSSSAGTRRPAARCARVVSSLKRAIPSPASTASSSTSRPLLLSQPLTATDTFSPPRSKSHRSIRMPAGLRISRHTCRRRSCGCCGMPCAVQYSGAATMRLFVRPRRRWTKSLASGQPCSTKTSTVPASASPDAVHDPHVDQDVRIAEVEFRQRRQQQMLRQLRMHTDDERAARAQRRQADRLVDQHQLRQQRPAGLQVARADRCQRHALRRAGKELHAETVFERGDELLHRRHAHLQPAGSSRQATFLGGTNEVVQRAQLVHRRILGCRSWH